MNPYNEYFPPGFSLETEKVLLRPLAAEDIPLLAPVASSPSIWKYFTFELNTEPALSQWVYTALEERSRSIRVPFAIVEKATGALCGSTSFGNISFYDKRLEIGWTWLGEDYQGSGVNRHAKFAMLRYAFERMAFERVEIKTDNLNERSKQALRKIGATEEGILRSHMLMPHGRRRDSIYFSMLRAEWPFIKEKYFLPYLRPGS